MNLYLTADAIGIPTGGGLVTKQELQAFGELGPCRVISRDELEDCKDPWGWDKEALRLIKYDPDYRGFGPYGLCHVYSGTFSKTVQYLKSTGCKISWTIAAHDREVSKREHEKLGLTFNYPHLVDENLWNDYIRGYRLADLIITPSTRAKEIVEAYGSCNNIEVIPHGCDVSSSIKPLPAKFTIGYIGAYGADKGVAYLLQAWKALNYKDATLLLAGRDSTSDFVASHLVPNYGGGNIQLLGWVEDTSIFYNRISGLVQPSCTEGWALSVGETMAHGRPVLCSEGAGACDMVPEMSRFKACDVEAIVAKIRMLRELYSNIDSQGWQEKARPYSWNLIRERYGETWKKLMK